MPGAQNYDENNISTLINSINEIKCKKIHIELGGNDETKLRFCIIFQDKISIFQTNNIASSDVRVLIYLSLKLLKTCNLY